MGGFFAIKFAEKHPQRVSKLILISPAGILPTPSYLAWLFKIGFPTQQVRVLRRAAAFIVYSLCDFVQTGPRAYYWLQLNASPHAFGDRVVATFLSTWRESIRLHWNSPVLADILTLTVPVGFIYGENDNVLPKSQGLLVQRLMNAKAIVGVVGGVWHMPYQQKTATDFMAQLACLLPNTQIPNPSKCILNGIRSLEPESTGWALWDDTVPGD
eukprot:3935936-Rhodomonas_salina.1